MELGAYCDGNKSKSRLGIPPTSICLQNQYYKMIEFSLRSKLRMAPKINQRVFDLICVFDGEENLHSKP